MLILIAGEVVRDVKEARPAGDVARFAGCATKDQLAHARLIWTQDCESGLPGYSCRMHWIGKYPEWREAMDVVLGVAGARAID